MARLGVAVNPGGAPIGGQVAVNRPASSAQNRRSVRRERAARCPRTLGASRIDGFRLGLVDASTVAIAERLDVTTMATLDHRDFPVIRPAHCDVFDLVPARAS